MRPSGLIALTSVLLILFAWELVCRLTAVPDFILPTPLRIMTVAIIEAQRVHYTQMEMFKNQTGYKE